MTSMPQIPQVNGSGLVPRQWNLPEQAIFPFPKPDSLLTPRARLKWWS